MFAFILEYYVSEWQPNGISVFGIYFSYYIRVCVCCVLCDSCDLDTFLCDDCVYII